MRQQFPSWVESCKQNIDIKKSNVLFMNYLAEFPRFLEKYSVHIKIVLYKNTTDQILPLTTGYNLNCAIFLQNPRYIVILEIKILIKLPQNACEIS